TSDIAIFDRKSLRRPPLTDRASLPASRVSCRRSSYASGQQSHARPQRAPIHRLTPEIVMSLIETRGPQMFPTLSAAQIETVRRFTSGSARDFAPGESVFEAGQRGVPMWLVVKGAMNVVRRDGLNHEAPIISHGVGQFSGEVSQLAGREALATARAGA